MSEDYQQANPADKRKRSKAHVEPINGYGSGCHDDNRPRKPFPDTSIAEAYETDRVRLERWNAHGHIDMWIAWDKETGESIIEGRWRDEYGDIHKGIVSDALGHDTEAVLCARAKAHGIPLRRVYRRPHKWHENDIAFHRAMRKIEKRRRAEAAAAAQPFSGGGPETATEAAQPEISNRTGMN
jgi:hypothetical protein